MVNKKAQLMNIAGHRFITTGDFGEAFSGSSLSILILYLLPQVIFRFHQFCQTLSFYLWCFVTLQRYCYLEAEHISFFIAQKYRSLSRFSNFLKTAYKLYENEDRGTSRTAKIVYFITAFLIAKPIILKCSLPDILSLYFHIVP